jgi:hypothetical protein
MIKPCVRTSRINTNVLVVVWILTFWCGIDSYGGQQDLRTTADTIRVTASPELAKYWQIHAAGLRQEPSGTTGFLEIENVYNTRLHGGVLYAEYFDEEGRLCFTLTFSQERNIGDRTAISTHETRTLYSAASGLSPVTRVAEARIYLLRQGDMEDRKQPRQVEAIAVRAPATVNSNVPVSAVNLRLTSELSSVKDGVLVLLVAKVNIDQLGVIQDVRIISPVTPAINTWFNTFIRQLDFYPATTAGVPLPSELLFRVTVNMSDRVSPSALAAHRLAQMKIVLPEINGIELPPVTDVVFNPVGEFGSVGTSRIVRTATDFQLVVVGTDWSNPHYDWIHAEGMPQHVARRLPDELQP